MTVDAIKKVFTDAGLIVTPDNTDFTVQLNSHLGENFPKYRVCVVALQADNLDTIESYATQTKTFMRSAVETPESLAKYWKAINDFNAKWGMTVNG